MAISDKVRLLILDYETTGVPAQDHFPIEIGVVFADNEFNELERYEQLIWWPRLFKMVSRDEKDWTWKDEYATGYKYHKITPQDLTAGAIFPSAVCNKLRHIMNNHGGDKYKWILCSDNIQFEYKLTETLYKAGNYKWPYHYCGWDTSLFLDMVGVGDPPSSKKAHRALADAVELHEYLLKAKNKLDVQ